MTRRDINEGNAFRQGYATTALEEGATTGQVPAVASDGQVEFVTAGGGSRPAGSDGEVQFNDNGSFGAAAGFVYDNQPSPILKLCAIENGTAEIAGNGLGVQLQLLAADGDATHVGGEIVVRAGGSNGFAGGDATVAAGVDLADGGGGAVHIESGGCVGGDGGDIGIRANPAGPAGNRGGDINVVAGQGTVHGGNVTVQGGGGDGNVQVYSGDGNQGFQADNSGLTVLGKVGFYGGVPVAQQTGVAVSAAAIHAALVNLGLITA